MTAADRPRVGDTITTAAQVRALPHGTVVRTHNGILCETQGVGLATPSWYAQGRMLEAQHLPARVLYVPGEQAVGTCVHCGQFIDPEGFAEDGSSNCAASQEGPADDLGNMPHEIEAARRAEDYNAEAERHAGRVVALEAQNEDLTADRDALAAKLARVEALADEWERDEAYACTDASKCVRCVSFQRAVIRIRAALNEGDDRA